MAFRVIKNISKKNGKVLYYTERDFVLKNTLKKQLINKIIVSNICSHIPDEKLAHLIFKTFIDEGYDGLDGFLRQYKYFKTHWGVGLWYVGMSGPPVSRIKLPGSLRMRAELIKRIRSGEVSKDICCRIHSFLQQHQFKQYFVAYYKKHYIEIVKEICKHHPIQPPPLLYTKGTFVTMDEFLEHAIKTHLREIKFDEECSILLCNGAEQFTLAGKVYPIPLHARYIICRRIIYSFLAQVK